MTFVENPSEVARLLQRIQQEYDAAQNALTGLAQGSARHEFITAKMENMGHYHEQLAQHVGSQHAAMLVAQQLEGTRQ